MFFELSFKLWDEIDVDTVKVTKQPVGKQLVSFEKLTKPARWQQIWLEDTPKPQGMRIWFEKHQLHFSALVDFEDDDIEEFEGFDMLDQDDLAEEEDDTAWLFPPKGPGEFKNLKRKKRGRKGKKKGKKAKKQMKSDL